MPDDAPDRAAAEREAARRNGLLAALFGALLAALLVRAPLLAVPGYEAGFVVGLAAALAGCVLGFELARARPLVAELRWGVLRTTPGEAVYEEARSGLLAVAPVVLLPLFVLVTQAARTGCRWAPGLRPFLLVALPAAFGGVALGLLGGTLTRRRLRALALLLLFIAFSIGTTLAEGLIGPRHVVHDLLLGPISIGAYMGHDRGLSFPPSVYLHRLFAVIAFTAAMAFAAWLRSSRDAPAGGAADEEPGPDGGWSASRAAGPERTRFLLLHHRKGPRRLLLLLGLLALPFLLHPHAVGLLSGRALLEREMPAVLETRHFRLHHAPGTATEAHLERLAVEHEHAWMQLSRWLEIEPTWKVEAWLHPDEASLFRTTGARGYVFAAPWNHEYHAVPRDGSVRQLRHELVHVLASEFGARPFGASWSTALIEGLATALDEGFARAPEAHEAIAAARAVGHVPPAERLTSLAGFAAQDMDLSYRAAASFAGFLLLEYGPRPFEIAYAHADFEKAYGLSSAALGRQWFDFLENRVAPSRVTAARARRRFDPRSNPAFHRTPCPRLGVEAAFTSPARRARLLSLADRPDAAADAWCEAWRAGADPRHLEAAAEERLRSGDLASSLALVERTLQAPVLDEDRELSLRRRRALLLAALGRGAEAEESLLSLTESLGADRAPGAAAEEGDALLEQLRLDLLGCGGADAEEYARAALQEGGAAELLARRPDWAPAQGLVLQLSPRANGEARRRREELALRFAESSPATPVLVAAHLREQALAAERATDWSRAAALHARILSISGLPVLERLAAEDGLERARLAPELGRAARAAQP